MAHAAVGGAGHRAGHRAADQRAAHLHLLLPPRHRQRGGEVQLQHHGHHHTRWGDYLSV